MNKQYRYVWNGVDSEERDKHLLGGIRKLIILDGNDNPEIVEVHSNAEYEMLVTQMKKDGWEIKESKVHGNPRTSLWVRHVSK